MFDFLKPALDAAAKNRAPGPGAMPPRGGPPGPMPQQAEPEGGPPSDLDEPMPEEGGDEMPNEGAEVNIGQIISERAKSLSREESQAFFNGITVPALQVLKKIIPEIGPAIDQAIAKKGQAGAMPAPGGPPGAPPGPMPMPGPMPPQAAPPPPPKMGLRQI